MYEKTLVTNEADVCHIAAISDLSRLQMMLSQVVMGTFNEPNVNKNKFIVDLIESMIRAKFAINVLMVFYDYDYCEDMMSKYVEWMNNNIDRIKMQKEQINGGGGNAQ